MTILVNLVSLLFVILPISAILTVKDVKYKTEYFNAKVDNFGFSTNHTFKLRYLINDTFWNPKAGAPIFIYTGNEGDIVPFATNTGIMWELAPEFNALLLFIEHRYYGESMPFGNLSFTDPKYSGYLSSSQALADYVALIYHIKKSHNLPLYHNPVIAFGGSYGGMLAAWIRMKYPSAITGSLASSAPIWQFTGMTPCYAFNRVTTSVYKMINSFCYESIKKSWKSFDNMASTIDGISWIKETFKACQDLKTREDVNKLKSWLNDNWVNIAQSNYPYKTNFDSPLPGHPVEVACQRMKKTLGSDREILQNIFKGISVYFNFTGEAKCLDLSSEYVPDPVDLAWTYQTCTEMVMPMCSDGPNDMFLPSIWNLTQVSEACFKTYGVKPQANLVEKLYGGKHISSASNIIFSNGLLDPWSSGGVKEPVSKDAIVVIIPESAHHLDLRFSDPQDPVSVREARKKYAKTFKRWIIKSRK